MTAEHKLQLILRRAEKLDVAWPNRPAPSTLMEYLNFVRWIRFGIDKSPIPEDREGTNPPPIFKLNGQESVLVAETDGHKSLPKVDEENFLVTRTDPREIVLQTAANILAAKHQTDFDLLSDRKKKCIALDAIVNARAMLTYLDIELDEIELDLRRPRVP